MHAYYNDNDPYCAQWLRNLIAAGHLPSGDVDDRSILKVEPDDLGFQQAHFFAGIGGWPLALVLADWPDDREVWTASCPCQPLSSAGQRSGHADPRHLWPAFYRLVAERLPATIFGEQVSSADGREWLAGIRADLEHLGYAVGAADLPAASVGAPHIRQRLFWVAYADNERWQGQTIANNWRAGVGASGAIGGLADAIGGRAGARRGDDGEMRGLPSEERAQDGSDLFGRSGATGGLGDAASEGRHRLAQWPEQQGPQGLQLGGSGARGFWDGAVWLPCLDGKARRVESAIQPLAHGIPNRVGILRGSGNAIVPQVAAEFVKACLDAVRLLNPTD